MGSEKSKKEANTALPTAMPGQESLYILPSNRGVGSKGGGTSRYVNPTALFTGKDHDFEKSLFDKKLPEIPSFAIKKSSTSKPSGRYSKSSRSTLASKNPLSGYDDDDDDDSDGRCFSICGCLRYIKILLMAFGLRLQSWARRMRRQRNHLQLWTPLCLILWTIVYICMAWEYESWRNMRNGVDAASLLQDTSAAAATCGCGDGGDGGVVAYVDGDQSSRFCLLPNAITSSTSSDALGCAIDDDNNKHSLDSSDFGFRHLLRVLFQPSAADGPVEWKEFSEGKFLIRWGARYNPDAVTQGKVHQWITYSFVHNSPNHFLFNALGLVLLGYFLEWRYGAVLLFVFSLPPAIVGSFFSTLIDPPCSALVGGSGIVYALLGLFIADRIQFLRTTDVQKRSFGLVIIMLVFVTIMVIVSLITNGSSSAHSVHFVALLTSLITAAPMLYENASDEQGSKKEVRQGLVCAVAWIVVSLFSLALIIIVYSLPESKFDCK